MRHSASLALTTLAALLGMAFAIVVVPLPREAPDIPYGHLPPPGECRIWMPDQPTGQQPPPGSCEALAGDVPLGGWLIHRATPDTVGISAYSVDVPNLVGALRYYDAKTLEPLDEPPADVPTARLEVPHGHLPPPGECRIWHPTRSPGRQPPPSDCGEVLDAVPAGAWLLYRETPDTVMVTAYHPQLDGLIVGTEVFDVIP